MESSRSVPLRHRLDDTAEAWRTWSGLHQSYDGPWADLVHMSGKEFTFLMGRKPHGRISQPEPRP